MDEDGPRPAEVMLTQIIEIIGYTNNLIAEAGWHDCQSTMSFTPNSAIGPDHLVTVLQVAKHQDVLRPMA